MSLGRPLATLALLIGLAGTHAIAQDGPRSHPRPFYRSKAFWTALALDTGAMAADYAESESSFRRGAHETDPIYGSRRPSTARMYSIGIPTTFVITLGSYELSTRLHAQDHGLESRLGSWVPVGYDAASHIRWAIEDSQLQDRRFRARRRLK